MCSIGGWISSKPLSPATSLALTQALLWYGQDRGDQSAGIWAHGKVVKRALHPAKVMAIRAVRELLSKPTSLVLTHTRWPTSGGTGDRQAQPFARGNVVTVHNGHISNIKEMKKWWGIEKESGVDSELFTAFAAKHGIKRMPEFSASVFGSMAVAAVVDGELYLIRDGNPIEYDTLTIGDTELLVFGSTEVQVRSALKFRWLIPSGRTTTLPTGPLFHVTPTGVEQIADRVYRTYTSGPVHPTSTVSGLIPMKGPWTMDKARGCLVNQEGFSMQEVEAINRDLRRGMAGDHTW